MRKQKRYRIYEDIEPSERAVKNICDSKKFCKAQGKITFGQLKALVESAKAKKLMTDVGEGGYKATLRLLPWFLPQLAFAGFTASIVRAFNKIIRPTLEDTTGYKTWWGKTILRLFNMIEGELNITDPLTKIFFISDGLLTMLDDKEKIKFARHIANIAGEKADNEEVPEFFVENELRNWLNEKFLLDPPLQPKEVSQEVEKIEDKDDTEEELPFKEVNENGIKKRVFKESTDNHELKWHFDLNDRKVKVVKSNGWMFQMDNQLPVRLNEGDVISIPKGMYHRVIKGKGDLIVKIKESEEKEVSYDEEYLDKIEKLINKFLSSLNVKVRNFSHYEVIVGKGKYDSIPVIKIYGLFEKPFSMAESEKSHIVAKQVIQKIKDVFPFAQNMMVKGGSSSTIESHRENYNWEKEWLRK
jgi:hypothetical protein